MSPESQLLRPPDCSVRPSLRDSTARTTTARLTPDVSDIVTRVPISTQPVPRHPVCPPWTLGQHDAISPTSPPNEARPIPRTTCGFFVRLGK
jgi:hypothetical protein